MNTDISSLVEKAKKEAASCWNLRDLDMAYKKYFGKKGKITLLFASLKDVPEDERSLLGKKANEAKKKALSAFEQRARELKEAERKQETPKEWIDVTAPGIKPAGGHLHPLTITNRQVREIFQQMGFSVALGPEVEDEWHNFDALNIPKEHPARDVWDTPWLKSKVKSQKSLLRTHTSPVQIRYMEKNNPPLRIIAPGRVFRHEATDAAHEINFYQIEGLMVDKDVSVAHFKAVIQEFFQRFFVRSSHTLPGVGKTEPIQIRLRPSYFPFVEPGFEVDMSCLNCGGKGCSACAQSGWLEMMGAGMVHPKVFEAVRLNPREWQGFAFGIGLDRLAMMKYKIPDIRLFYAGGLRFLRQF